MKILVDMNLSPLWRELFGQSGIEARHWSEIGDHTAPDSAIMAWARSNGHIVFTHDLDFGAILAQTREGGPSVLQLRVADTTPDVAGRVVLEAIAQFAGELDRGAIVVIEPANARARLLPLRPQSE